jgi:hypothetical protein
MAGGGLAAHAVSTYLRYAARHPLPRERSSTSASCIRATSALTVRCTESGGELVEAATAGYRPYNSPVAEYLRVP